MQRGVPLFERITSSAGAVIGLLAAMLFAGWASFGHGHAADDSCAAAHGHACAGHGEHEPHPACDARPEEGTDDGEHDSDHCALCEVQARLPNVVPAPIALPELIGTATILVVDAPDAPAIRVPRPRLARGPPDSSAS